MVHLGVIEGGEVDMIEGGEVCMIGGGKVEASLLKIGKISEVKVFNKVGRWRWGFQAEIGNESVVKVRSKVETVEESVSVAGVV